MKLPLKQLKLSNSIYSCSCGWTYNQPLKSVCVFVGKGSDIIIDDYDRNMYDWCVHLDHKQQPGILITDILTDQVFHSCGAYV